MRNFRRESKRFRFRYTEARAGEDWPGLGRKSELICWS